MSKEEILEGNKLILNFMDVKPKSVIPNIYYWNDAPFFYISEDNEEKVMKGITEYAKYHSSYDWLMPVVEKIESMDYIVSIELSDCQISGYEYSIDYYTNTSKINAVYTSVVEFIKWYNDRIKKE